MSDSSDEDFHIDIKPKGGGKSKGKSKASKARDLEVFGLDSLLSEATYEAKRAEITNEVLANKEDLDAILNRTFDIAKEKAKTDQTEAQDRSNNLTIMGDSFIKIPGVIRVLCPQSETPMDVRFSFPCPKDQLKALYESLRLVADDEADLEEVLRSGLVPWVRQKLGGQAPSDVCLWLWRVIMGHESSAVVLAAEEALMGLLEESRREWKMEYQDVQHIWRRCGAVWLVEGRGATEDMRNEEEMVDEGDMSCCLRRNLKPALNVICVCMRKGAHDFSSDDLQELMLDLAAVSLDEGVNSSCMTELYTTMVAVADAIPSGLFDDAQKFSSLVDALCNLSARAVEKLVEPVSFVLLAHNVPYYCSGNNIGEDGQELSLRHEVCHRLLSRRFLCNTSYVGDDSPKGFERALKALHVLFDNEDNLLQDSSEEGYQRQYAIVALANEMAAGTLVVSQSGKPDAAQSKSMIAAVDKIYGKLINTMQPCVQMSKTILNSMKNIYAPYVATSTGRQGKLSFASSAFEEKSCGDSSGSDVENEDYDDEEESEESLDDMGDVDDDDNDVEMVETAPN